MGKLRGEVPASRLFAGKYPGRGLWHATAGTSCSAGVVPLTFLLSKPEKFTLPCYSSVSFTVKWNDHPHFTIFVQIIKESFERGEHSVA